MGSERRRGPLLTQTPNLICPEALCLLPAPPHTGRDRTLGQRDSAIPMLSSAQWPYLLFSFSLTHSILTDCLLKIGPKAASSTFYLNSYHLVVMGVRKIAWFWRKEGIFWGGSYFTLRGWLKVSSRVWLFQWMMPSISGVKHGELGFCWPLCS